MAKILPLTLFVVILAGCVMTPILASSSSSTSLRGAATRSLRATNPKLTKQQRKRNAIDALNKMSPAEKAAFIKTLAPVRDDVVGRARSALGATKQKFSAMPKWKRKHRRKTHNNGVTASPIPQRTRKLQATSSRPTLQARLNEKFAGMVAEGALSLGEQAFLMAQEGYEANLPDSFTTQACIDAEAELNTTKEYFGRLVEDKMEQFDETGSAFQEGLEDVQEFEEDLSGLHTSMSTAITTLTAVGFLPYVGPVCKTLNRLVKNARDLIKPFKDGLTAVTTNVVDPIEPKLSTMLEKNEAAAGHIETAKYAAQKYIIEPARFLDGRCERAREPLGTACVALEGTLRQANDELAAFEADLEAGTAALVEFAEFAAAVTALLADEVYNDVMTLLDGIAAVLKPFKDFIDFEITLDLGWWIGSYSFSVGDILDGLSWVTDFFMGPLEAALAALGMPSFSFDMFDLPTIPNVNLPNLGLPDLDLPLFDLPNLGLPDLGIDVCPVPDEQQAPSVTETAEALTAGTRIGRGFGLPSVLKCMGSPFVTFARISCRPEHNFGLDLSSLGNSFGSLGDSIRQADLPSLLDDIGQADLPSLLDDTIGSIGDSIGDSFGGLGI